MSIFKTLFSGEQAEKDAALIKELRAQTAALDKSQAMIEFNMDGTIITANANFLAVMGYQLHEIQGQHHRMFVEPGYAASAEYLEFWNELNRGNFCSGEFKRLGKNEKNVWIQASYNPVLDEAGRPYKVVKCAYDITEQKEAELVNRSNSNIANALKICQTNVMLADNDMVIVYMNDQLQQVLSFLLTHRVLLILAQQLLAERHILLGRQQIGRITTNDIIFKMMDKTTVTNRRP